MAFVLVWPVGAAIGEILVASAAATATVLVAKTLGDKVTSHRGGGGGGERCKKCGAIHGGLFRGYCTDCAYKEFGYSNESWGEFMRRVHDD